MGVGDAAGSWMDVDKVCRTEGLQAGGAASIVLADRRRGACPTLSRPMQTGDGLLVRLRPATPGLSPDEMIALARAARRNGNGILDITARGNVQIRGLSPDTVGPLAEEIAEAGIVPVQGIAIETPPLAGYDPREICNPLPLAAELRSAVEAALPPLVLAPKLSIVVDGGGCLGLGGVVADIRLMAEVQEEKVLWRLALAGDARTAMLVAVLPTDAVVGAVMELLRRLSALGPMARGRDLVVAVKDDEGEAVAQRHPAGVHRLGSDRVVLGAALAFGQVETESLIAFVEETRALGAVEYRLAPDHALLVLGLTMNDAAAFADCAARWGLRPDPDDKSHHIAVCAGKGACASAMVDMKEAARQVMADAPELLDGSIAVHVSGCAKGCARPSTAALTLVGAPTGYGLVVNGAASARPSVYIDEDKLAPALSHLNALVRNEKHAGESARACLTRLGASRIIAAVQQE